jgi:hypothetical protein
LRQFELNQFAVIEKRGAPNFVQIVILGSHPENRNRIYPLLGQILCDSDSGDGLVNGIPRATEESDLLARNHGNRTLFKAAEIGKCGGSSAEKFVLLAQDCGNFSPTRIGIVECTSYLEDVLQIRLVLKKRAYAFVGLQVVSQQFGLVWQNVYRQGATMHGF